MNPWCMAYGTFVSVCSFTAVLMMRKAMRDAQGAAIRMHEIVSMMTVATSEMFDAMTPEQIRGLSHGTVHMANTVPPWHELRDGVEWVRNDGP